MSSQSGRASGHRLGEDTTPVTAPTGPGPPRCGQAVAGWLAGEMQALSGNCASLLAAAC
jgi:hypothetical protein